MRDARLPGPMSVCAAALLVSACGGGDAPAGSKACRETPPAELSASGHGCALAAEMESIADTLATVTDGASADKAIPVLKRSSARLKALRTERLKLNDAPDAGAKGAMVGTHTRAMSAAARSIVDETTRLARSTPDLYLKIAPALEDVEF